ncbi:TPA: hypothetical protein N0F65_003301 [Lagenidium giganteum]|uniref:EGF-like domain-containing protein n=1 Tax=Lagenidium giganteum TaxID=4803 RepID=A0AAV2YZC9_9STRA|nr:TPA: hypothetical protein N0F65_003301 [Lagenidium giganteum]
MRVVLAFLALATASNAWDSRFACCGGCSSSVRSAGEQLQGNAVIFPWQPQLPANASTAATTCAIGFPADASLGEAIGQYRVRSGGAQGELVHDQDALCCANGGLCANNKSDASGVCSCVQQWQFSGDHCELTGMRELFLCEAMH